MNDERIQELARMGYCVAASSVIPDMLQGWKVGSMHLPVTGSYETEAEAWEAIDRSHRRGEEKLRRLFAEEKEASKD